MFFFLGNFSDKNCTYILESITKINKIYKIPKNLKFFFVCDPKSITKIVETFPKEVRKDLREKCSKNILFTYYYKNQSIVVFNLKKGDYIFDHQDALIGDLLHEIAHVNLRIKGVHNLIDKNYNRSYLTRFIKIKNLPYKYRNSELLFKEIGGYGSLLLKDLYCNTELINKGLANYVFLHYYWQFRSIKSCPKPVFYVKFKEAAKKNPMIVAIAFEFEFILLSAVLPFKNFNDKMFNSLIKLIGKCLKLDVVDMLRKCNDLSAEYLTEFPELKEDFPHYFFLSLFNKLYGLLS